MGRIKTKIVLSQYFPHCYVSFITFMDGKWVRQTKFPIISPFTTFSWFQFLAGWLPSLGIGGLWMPQLCLKRPNSPARLMRMMRRRKIKSEGDISLDGSGVVHQTGVPTTRCSSSHTTLPNCGQLQTHPALALPTSTVTFSIDQVFGITRQRLYVHCIQRKQEISLLRNQSFDWPLRFLIVWGTFLKS